MSVLESVIRNNLNPCSPGALVVMPVAFSHRNKRQHKRSRNMSANVERSRKAVAETERGGTRGSEWISCVSTSRS